MPDFKIACWESRAFEVIVQGAKDLDDAIEKVKNDPCLYIGNEPGEYIDGSFEVNDIETQKVINNIQVNDD